MSSKFEVIHATQNKKGIFRNVIIETVKGERFRAVLFLRGINYGLELSGEQHSSTAHLLLTKLRELEFLPPAGQGR